MTERSAPAAAALFDLDGTLVDTAPDMAGALNRVLVSEGKEPLGYETIRNYVSHGATRLVNLGFGGQLTADEQERLRQLFLVEYNNGLCVHSRLFPGFAEVLDFLDDESIPWGVVTNKPGWLTDPLLKFLDLFDRAACVVSGDTVAKRKPHPMPLIHAAEQIDVPATECVYLGDAERDVEAARAAGMHSLIAAYGYIDGTDNPDSWNADGIVFKPTEFLNWMNLDANQASQD